MNYAALPAQIEPHAAKLTGLWNWMMTRSIVQRQPKSFLMQRSRIFELGPNVYTSKMVVKPFELILKACISITAV